MPSIKTCNPPLGLAASAGENAYAAKALQYFCGARAEFVDELPDDPNAEILEIGCGSGGTGRLAIAAGKCARYRGVELCAQAAGVAAQYLHEVIHGDVERLELPWAQQSFDALIMSEVIEHLADPWAVLRRLHGLLKPGALVLAGSPNVAHYRVILMLLRGDWRVADSGVMDRTHLRWFTPKTYQRLFEDSGYAVEKVVGIGQHGFKARMAAMFLCGRCNWLLARQIKLRARRV